MLASSEPWFVSLLRSLNPLNEKPFSNKTANSSHSHTTHAAYEAEVRLPEGNYHQRFWCNTSGKVLKLLLHHACYCVEAQQRIAKFFEESVASFLGSAPLSMGEQSPWFSFMTDDGIPIEFSWDWGNGSQLPRIRFSIEPVGLQAGTNVDRWNQHAAIQFHQNVVQKLPNISLAWFNHFHGLFCNEDVPLDSTSSGHSTSIFYAFDLGKKNNDAKAYFFPGPRAQHLKQSTWQVIYDAIRTASGCTPQNLEALFVLHKFFSNSWASPLELEMLATDLTVPENARLKIYFRSRDTRLKSIAHIISLGGLDKSKSTQVGLRNIELLLGLLYGRNAIDDDIPEETNHRTAGILYYASFRLGDKYPKIKLYIPVRHYSTNDQQIFNGIQAFLTRNGNGAYVSNYEEFLQQAL